MSTVRKVKEAYELIKTTVEEADNKHAELPIDGVNNLFLEDGIELRNGLTYKSNSKTSSMLPLPPYCGTIEDNRGLQCVQFCASFQIMQFLFECGLHSGHFYQPKINHRDFDIGVLYDKRETRTGASIPPLLKSLIDPCEGDDFTLQTPLSCLMYEINKTDTDADVDESLALYTTLKCKVKTNEGYHPNLVKGRLKNRQAGPVGGRAFKRLLSIFNFYWADDAGKEKGDDCVVGPLDWAAFFSSFRDIDTSSREGFSLFLRKYNIIGFTADSNLSMCQIRRLFGFYLRTLSTIRCGSFDCQHRCLTMAWFSQGFFCPSIVAPMRPRIDLSEPLPRDLAKAIGVQQDIEESEVIVLLSDDDEDEVKEKVTKDMLQDNNNDPMLEKIRSGQKPKDPKTYWLSCQVFKPMRVQIAVPTQTIRDALDSLKGYGASVTVAAGRSITVTTAAAVSFVVDMVHREIIKATEAKRFETLAFDNYLCIAPEANKYNLENGVWSRNGSVVYKALWDAVFLTGNIHVQQALCQFEKVASGNTDYRSKYLIVRTTTALIYKGHKNCLKEAQKGRANMPGGWAFHNIPFQAAATDSSILAAYARLWSSPAPEVQQRTNIESDLSYFVSPEWLNTFVFPAHYYAMKMVSSDLAIEEKIIKLLRSEETKEDEETRRKYLYSQKPFVFRDWKPIALLTKGAGKGIKMWGEKFGNITDKMATLYPAGSGGGKAEIINRIEAIISVNLLKDLFETISRLGYNPKLKGDLLTENQLSENNAVQFYLDQPLHVVSPVVTCKGPKQLEYKSSMEMMIYLWCRHLEHIVSNRIHRKLRVLMPYAGPVDCLMNGLGRGAYSEGIKLTTNTGFPDTAREKVIANAGTDLSGFCHAEYKFSAFADKFMEDENFDPITDYGDSTKNLRMAVAKGRQSVAIKAGKKNQSSLDVLREYESSVKKRSHDEKVAKSVVESIQQYYAPVKPGDSRQKKLKENIMPGDMGKILSCLAVGGYISGIKMKKDSVVDFIADNKAISELEPLLNFVEAGIQTRKKQRNKRAMARRQTKKLQEITADNNNQEEEDINRTKAAWENRAMQQQKCSISYPRKTLIRPNAARGKELLQPPQVDTDSEDEANDEPERIDTKESNPASRNDESDEEMQETTHGKEEKQQKNDTTAVANSASANDSLGKGIESKRPDCEETTRKEPRRGGNRAAKKRKVYPATKTLRGKQICLEERSLSEEEEDTLSEEEKKKSTKTAKKRKSRSKKGSEQETQEETEEPEDRTESENQTHRRRRLTYRGQGRTKSV